MEAALELLGSSPGRKARVILLAFYLSLEGRRGVRLILILLCDSFPRILERK